MRVLHLLASPFWSGPMENVALLAQAQRALGHEVSVAIDRKRTEAAAEELAAPRLRALGLLDEGGLELSVKSMPWQVVADGLRLRGREVDVVHSHFSHDHLIARLSGPSGARRIRSVHAARSFRSLPHAHAYTVPAPEFLARVAHPKMVLAPLVGAEFGPAVDREALRAELGLGAGWVIGMVSTFQPSRRHALGIEAFALVRQRRPDARLVLVGDGALGPALREQVRVAGLEGAVTFAGYRAGAEFARWLQALDEVWILGLGNDFSGRAAAQARACGVRVVAVDEGALALNADAVVAADARAVAEASGGRVEGERVPALSNAEIARDVLALYQAAGARR